MTARITAVELSALATLLAACTDVNFAALEEARRCRDRPEECDAAGPAEEGGTCNPRDGCEVDGFWQGSTTTEDALHFEVRGDSLVMFWFDWTIPECGSQGSAETAWSPGVGLFDRSPVTGSDEQRRISYELSGRFLSSTDASGELSISYSEAGCTSDTSVRWSATHVRCGDGSVEWPETCDRGDDTESRSCSDACQLAAAAETEPNDDTAAANGPFASDAVIRGSISPATDGDVFAIGNARARSTRVRFETHGPSTGTCGISTRLSLVASSAPTITNTDGGLGKCSVLGYTLAPEQTIYVQVESGSPGSPVAGYRLHIDFQ